MPLTCDLILTTDKPGFALDKELQTLFTDIVKTLKANKQLPETVELKPAEIVNNPFA